LELRNPKPESVRIISEFARKTGDLVVLSQTDIQLLALAYDIECERNDGNWRLRSIPGQRRTNGPPPSSADSSKIQDEAKLDAPLEKASNPQDTEEKTTSTDFSKLPDSVVDSHESTVDIPEEFINPAVAIEQEDGSGLDSNIEEHLVSQLEETSISPDDEAFGEEVADDSDSEGWITPSNIKRKQLENSNADASGSSEQKVMQAVR
jgi:RNA-binding protein NOB1